MYGCKPFAVLYHQQMLGTYAVCMGPQPAWGRMQGLYAGVIEPQSALGHMLGMYAGVVLLSIQRAA